VLSHSCGSREMAFRPRLLLTFSFYVTLYHVFWSLFHLSQIWFNIKSFANFYFDSQLFVTGALVGFMGPLTNVDHLNRAQYLSPSHFPSSPHGAPASLSPPSCTITFDCPIRNTFAKPITRQCFLGFPKSWGRETQHVAGHSRKMFSQPWNATADRLYVCRATQNLGPLLLSVRSEVCLTAKRTHTNSTHNLSSTLAEYDSTRYWPTPQAIATRHHVTPQFHTTVG
jgi:hypothetical protein